MECIYTWRAALSVPPLGTELLISYIERIALSVLPLGAYLLTSTHGAYSSEWRATRGLFRYSIPERVALSVVPLGTELSIITHRA